MQKVMGGGKKAKSKEAKKLPVAADRNSVQNNYLFMVAVINGDAMEVKNKLKDNVDLNITFGEIFPQADHHCPAEVEARDKLMDVLAINTEKMLASGGRKEELLNRIGLSTTRDTIEHNAKTATWLSPTALVYAIYLHHHEVVKLLISQPTIELNKADSSNERTALHEAVCVMNEKATKWLLKDQRFTDVDKGDIYGETALTRALRQPYYPRVKDGVKDKPDKFAKLIIRSGRSVDLSIWRKGDNAMDHAKRTDHADANMRLVDGGSCCWHCCGRERAGVVTRVCRGCRKAMYRVLNPKSSILTPRW
jgi:hypothetical protein